VHVDAMLRGLTWKQFAEWRTFYELEPFGDIRDDHRAALVAWVIAMVNRGKGSPPKIQDFLLKFEEDEPKKGVKGKGFSMAQQALGPLAFLADTVKK
jgi:hypothetical protein